MLFRVSPTPDSRFSSQETRPDILPAILGRRTTTTAKSVAFSDDEDNDSRNSDVGNLIHESDL